MDGFVIMLLAEFVAQIFITLGAFQISIFVTSSLYTSRGQLQSAAAMSVPTYTIKPALRCLRRASQQVTISRHISVSTQLLDPAVESTSAQTPAPPPLDPNTVSTRREERKLQRTGVSPIASRRRRAIAAEAQSQQYLSFEELPYQCFQEARKVLAADREIKLQQIDVERKRIARLESEPAAQHGGDLKYRIKLDAMRRHLEDLKIWADINDPMVKKRFEDGEGTPLVNQFSKKKIC
jgi:large subunit ribosomal protein L35